MPHIRVEYSQSAEGVDIAALCVVLRDAAVATGVFPVAGTRVRAFCADHVVIATGATWCASGVGRSNQAPIPVAAGALVMTPDQVMAGEAATGKVVIFDDEHYYMGGLMAEVLRTRGHGVTLVTAAADVSTWTHNTLEQHRVQKKLMEMEVTIIPLHTVVARGADTVTLACGFTDRQRDIACGTFVPVTLRRPVDTLYHSLTAEIAKRGAPAPTVTRIGDCLAPGTIAAAVYSGHRYARELGEPVPDGVPFRRELPALAND